MAADGGAVASVGRLSRVAGEGSPRACNGPKEPEEWNATRRNPASAVNVFEVPRAGPVDMDLQLIA
jgi:hypothetical protein